MEKADIGLIGLGVMGQNLALNLAGKGWKVAVWNRTVPGKEEHIVDNFIAKRAQGKSIVGTQTLEEFVDALKTPKVVFLMVQAGSAVDEMTGRLLPLLHKGDIIIDGGNSNFEDTERRVKELYEKGRRRRCIAWRIRHAGRCSGGMALHTADAEEYCSPCRRR